MIHNTVLRWIVTVLFVLSAAKCLFAVATGPRAWTPTVREVLHLVMSVAMVIMVWPWGMTLPTAAPLVFFLLAAAWFAATAVKVAHHRSLDSYHALMMLAMAWMYALMNGTLLPGQTGTPNGSDNVKPPHASMPDMSMPGMDMPDMPAASSSNGHPASIDAVNWLCAIGFGVAAAWWVYRYLAMRKTEPTSSFYRLTGSVTQAMMAAGMAIMFAMIL
ncbi:DUF5134 domain-containing protein [Mycobacterium shigaense]|uniref:Uncharacterized protein n=1 Tax=Mycobacterium shigaense TaxID=722731 RepID=A0A1Z4EK03_9MYCO|nr:DUF5134 domain-containing protein [Mycobacterium shigaense]MEA1123092.1 DUF5134 domain-containing protein [Mycobacterium shigaense]PRI15619.1 DUF5134 domain-containing protein [Mycobacterium shigaense]BAX93297.1 hypothetical protein MSG_03158 [Mycobacterium shigaense]